MSSILTNNGAMVALQTLKSINSNLSQTQSAIATGKDVASAKDNAAVWAISKVMESDVAGFKAISANLGLGQATTQVARQAAETTTDLLKQMKEKIVAAQEGNVDRTKIQTDIEALTDQIKSVTGAAQFNGLNLLSNTSATEGSGSANVMSSLDRSATGVTPAEITVQKQDLGTGKAEMGTVAAALATAAATPEGSFTLDNANESGAISLTSMTNEAAAGNAYAITFFETEAGTAPTAHTVTSTAAAGSTNAEAIASKIVYVAREGDTAADVAKGLANAWAAFASDPANNIDTDMVNITATGDKLNISKSADYSDAGDNLQVKVNSIAATQFEATGKPTIGGKFEVLNGLNVTTEQGGEIALQTIESLIQTSIDSAAAFGSTEKRIETQQDFVGGLMDAMKSGIGTLVDADMEEQSARLQALQVQQQLGVQALSIANQAPQQLLSLFR